MDYLVHLAEQGEPDQQDLKDTPVLLERLVLAWMVEPEPQVLVDLLDRMACLDFLDAMEVLAPQEVLVHLVLLGQLVLSDTLVVLDLLEGLVQVVSLDGKDLLELLVLQDV